MFSGLKSVFARGTGAARARFTGNASNYALWLVVAVAIFTAWPLTSVRLDRHDHPAHLLKAWQFFNEMLLHGRLSGYNHYWAFGYPVNDITSCGAEMWIALHRIGTFGLLSWEQTYKLSIASLILFTGLSSYAFARRYFNPFVAATAGIIAVLDPGGLFQGGWDWTYNFGVWPVMLSCCCLLMALAKLEDALDSPQRVHQIVAGSWIAAALWAHPLSLILLVLALPLLLADHWSRSAAPLVRIWARVAVAYGIGFGLAAFSVVPMLARSRYTFDRGAPADSVDNWAHRLLDLQVFHGTLAVLTALGLFGAVRILVGARRGALLLTAGFGLCLLIATDIPFNTLHAERIFPGLVKLESGRMLMGCKLFGFPLIAYGAGSLFSRGMERVGAASLRSSARWLLALGLLLPFIAPVSKRIYTSYINKTFSTEFSPDVIKDFDNLNRWALAERQSASDFYRIAFSAASIELLETASPMFTHTPIYIDIGTSAQQFGVFPADFDAELLTSLSVKYVVSDHPLHGPLFGEERSFGALRVYRFTQYRKERFTLLGQGQAQELEFSPDLIRLRVDNAEPNTRLKLHVAAYDRWEAVQQGKRLPIQIANAAPYEYPVLMEVPVQSGEIEFRYVRRIADWLGLALTLLTLGLMLRYTLLAERWPPRIDVVGFVDQHQRWFGGAALACLLAIALISVQRSRTRKHLLPATSIFHEVKSDNVRDGRGECRKLGALDFECQKPLRAEYTGGSWGAHLCMATDERQPITLSLITELGAGLQVLTDTFADDGSIQVSVDGQNLGSVATRRSRTDWRVFQFDTRQVAPQHAANVQITLSGAALRCFDVRKMP